MNRGLSSEVLQESKEVIIRLSHVDLLLNDRSGYNGSGRNE